VAALFLGALAAILLPVAGMASSSNSSRQASMQRVDAALRGNLVAIEPPEENRRLDHEQPNERATDLLH
jgi:hypothetical protein